MIYKRINITLPEDLLASLDKSTKTEYVTRSGYIREAIALKQRLDQSILREVSDKDSMANIIRSMHATRMSARGLREMGDLSYQEIQD